MNKLVNGLEKKRKKTTSLLDKLKEEDWSCVVDPITINDHFVYFSKLNNNRGVNNYCPKKVWLKDPEKEIGRIKCSLSSDINGLEKAILNSFSCMKRDEYSDAQNRRFYDRCNNESETAYMVVSRKRYLHGYGRFFLMLSKQSRNSTYSDLVLYLDHIQLNANLDYNDFYYSRIMNALKVSLFFAGAKLGKILDVDHLYLEPYAHPYYLNTTDNCYIYKKDGFAHIKRALFNNPENSCYLDFYKMITHKKGKNKL